MNFNTLMFTLFAFALASMATPVTPPACADAGELLHLSPITRGVPNAMFQQPMQMLGRMVLTACNSPGNSHNGLFLADLNSIYTSTADDLCSEHAVAIESQCTSHPQAATFHSAHVL